MDNNNVNADIFTDDNSMTVLLILVVILASSNPDICENIFCKSHLNTV